jgi:hypothetical protein
MSDDLFPPDTPTEPASPAGPAEVVAQPTEPAPLTWYTTPERTYPDGRKRPTYIMPVLPPVSTRTRDRKVKEYQAAKAGDKKNPRLFDQTATKTEED